MYAVPNFNIVSKLFVFGANTRIFTLKDNFGKSVFDHALDYYAYYNLYEVLIANSSDLDEKIIYDNLFEILLEDEIEEMIETNANIMSKKTKKPKKGTSTKKVIRRKKRRSI